MYTLTSLSSNLYSIGICRTCAVVNRMSCLLLETMVTEMCIHDRFYPYGTHPTNHLLSHIHLKLVCMSSSYTQGCGQRRLWGLQTTLQILGLVQLMNCGCIFYTNQLHTLLSSLPPTDWFAVVKISGMLKSL